ncbi:MAG: peroxiredoxin [Candidatus Dependentiae bacterium]|nr:peroxiredoxin [Candidatus Dependentiae bacterium]
MLKKSLTLLACVAIVTSQIKAKNNVLGKPAPIFKAKAVHPDGSIRDFDLQDYIGSDFILYFYPFDNTPGCTKQAMCFRDSTDRLKEKGLQVIGVSCDAPNTHKRFQKKVGIPYPLVSDTHLGREISTKYGAVGFFHSKRKTFLINKKGIVFKVFENVDIDNQIEDILSSFEKEYQK